MIAPNLVLALALTAPGLASTAPAVKLPAPPDIAAFMYPGRSPEVATRDGSSPGEWDGPGQSQMRLSLPYLKRRDESLESAEKALQQILQTIRAFGANPPDSAKGTAAVRQQLARMGGPSLDEARTAFLEAVTMETKRLQMVRKAAELASEAEVVIPGVDRDLVARRLKAIDAGEMAEIVEARIRAHRNLATGLVAYLDGDALGALEKMKRAARDGPEIALVHVYLGSLYYVFQQVDSALAEWRKALDLDPTNETVRQAIKDHLAERK